MKTKYRIRLSRKNEFNAYWAFLITLMLIMLGFAIKATKQIEMILITYAFTILLFTGMTYQGLEVIKEQ